MDYPLIFLGYFSYVIPALYFMNHVLGRKLVFTSMNKLYQSAFIAFLPVFLLRKAISKIITPTSLNEESKVV